MTPSPAPKVLVADDEIYMRRLLEATFRKGGFEPILVPDGEQALAAARSARPQLIVIDVMMPGLDGLSVVRQLKQDEATRGIPVIVLSAKGQALTRVEAEQAGAVLFLTKPFSPTQLLKEAARILAAT